MLVLIQVLILDKIPLRPGIPAFTPFIYPLFILLLPISAPTWFVLMISFFLGITLDTFADTGGIHALACLIMGASRKSILAFLLPKQLDEYKNTAPNITEMGWSPFLMFTTLLLLFHHSIFYIIEIWNLASPVYLLVKIATSLITTLILIIIYVLLFSKSISKTYYE